MRLHCIYLSIGLLTLGLNILLTLHIVRKYRKKANKRGQGPNEIITFKLTGGCEAFGIADQGIPCDDTIPLAHEK